MEYTWTFGQSFLVFLLIVFLSQALATRLRSLIPMPLIYGLLFAVGFAAGFLPRDLLLSSNMVTVGTIAFNMLVIHSGTMIDLRLLWRRRKETALCLLCTAAMVAGVLLVMGLVMGWDLALLSPGVVVGGGAACAIASRAVMAAHPEISVFPWMVFMFQGLFAVPVVTAALKKESAAFLREAGPAAAPAGGPPQAAAFGPCARLPQKYKTPAYYMGIIMVVAVANQALHATLLAPLGLNLNVTALPLGILLGHFGILDRGPLFRSNSYGLLILSLMGLMANTLANTAAAAMLQLVAPVLLALAVGTVLLAGCGWLLSLPLGLRPWQGVAMAVNAVMGFDVNRMLVENASAAAPEAQRQALAGHLSSVLGISTTLVSSGVSIFLASILANFV